MAKLVGTRVTLADGRTGVVTQALLDKAGVEARSVQLTIRLDPPACSGFNAASCPACGDCLCPRGQQKNPWPGAADPSCPLHGAFATHAQKPPEPTNTL